MLLLPQTGVEPADFDGLASLCTPRRFSIKNLQTGRRIMIYDGDVFRNRNAVCFSSFLPGGDGIFNLEQQVIACVIVSTIEYYAIITSAILRPICINQGFSLFFFKGCMALITHGALQANTKRPNPRMNTRKQAVKR